MSTRNRADGWEYAKLSGHVNESRVENLLLNDVSYQQAFLARLGKSHCRIMQMHIGGLNEHKVPCVFEGEYTKSKTDMYLLLDDGTQLKISVKKSLSGQVYLIGIDRFIAGFELQYHKVIPADVKRAIQLFWGSAGDVDQILNFYSFKKSYEIKKHRLVAHTLYQYDASLCAALINWFWENIYEITDFCFSRGLAKNQEDWANVIWYKNTLGENNVDAVFSIESLCQRVAAARNQISYGIKGGGTTIQLPFGFVQWHSPTKKIPGDIQFHHQYHKIRQL